jgi:hypothetical protein
VTVRRHRLALLGLALVLVLAVVPVATAGKAKPGGGGSGGTSTSTVSLVPLDSTDSQAHYGQRVTFAVSTSATDRPFVGLRCWQGTTWVYDGYIGFFPTYIGDPYLTLGGLYWSPSLSASCTARLFYYDSRGNQKVLATTSFTALP